MTNTDLMLWAMMGVGALAFLVFRNRGPRPVDLRLIPPHKMGDLPVDTDVRVSGTVAFSADSEPLLSPLTGRTCAAWVLRIEQKSNRRRRPSEQVLRQQHVADFLVQDDSGAVLVGGTGLKLLLDPAHSAEELSETLITLLSEHNVRTRDGNGPFVFHAYESVIEAGDTVTVIGSASPVQSSASAGYRGSTQRLRMGPPTSGPLVITHKLRYLG